MRYIIYLLSEFLRFCPVMINRLSIFSLLYPPLFFSWKIISPLAEYHYPTSVIRPCELYQPVINCHSQTLAPINYLSAGCLHFSRYLFARGRERERERKRKKRWSILILTVLSRPLIRKVTIRGARRGNRSYRA